MKILAISFLFLLFLGSCKSNEETIDPTGIVGKWQTTGITQSMNQDGSWGEWHINPTFAAVTPSIWQFASNGNFLIDGKPGGDCCFAGNKYTVSDDKKITFTELKPICPEVYCVRCSDWDYGKAGNDTLILRQCATRNKLVRVK